METTWRRKGLVVAAVAAFLFGGGPSIRGVFADDQKAGSTKSGLHPRVKIETSSGAFVVELAADKAPLSVRNFLQYAEAGFYDGTVFHRVKPGRLIQGGAYTSAMDLKTAGLRPPIFCESDNGMRNAKGSIALYREVSKIDSAAAEFFINVDDNPTLDKLRGGRGYTVFGKVVDGMDVVERIAESPVGTHPKYAAGYAAVVPREPIVIKRVQVVSPLDRKKALALAEEAEARIRAARAFAAMTAEERLAYVTSRLEKKHGGKFVQTDSGVRFLDLRVGTGLQPTIEDTVEVQYQVELLDGSMVENTYAGAPRKRKLERFVRGLQEGVQSMKEGGQRLFLVPPELAYGEGGQPGIIPSNAWLVFNIELLSVE